MKLVNLVGARPQFIKAAAVSRAIESVNQGEPGAIEEVLLHTGQHYDVEMSDRFFSELSLPMPKVNLGVVTSRHGAMTGRILEKTEEVLLQEKPDWVVVYGDTNSTLAGALAAKKLQIPVAHVEAGLRSRNEAMPEETNRILTDHCSDLLFTPTEAATRQLGCEGIGMEKVVQVGDVMLDVLEHYRPMACRDEKVLERFGLTDRPFALVTLHRAGNTDDARILSEILGALEEIAAVMPLVWPVHPRARQAMERLSLTPQHPCFHLLEPVGYLAMLALLDSTQLVLTDSGGLQKEAALCGKPTLVLREETEWGELLEYGIARLVGSDTTRILDGFAWGRSAASFEAPPFYGDGRAAEKIIESLQAVGVGIR